nr:polysaccharide pyruvyl transferase family protein [uncultured Sellimonas sp.]
MKIGIMSMQRVANYGSFLQAFGLKTLLEKKGHEVCFIDYHAGKPVVSYKKMDKVIYNLKKNPYIWKLYYDTKEKYKNSFYYLYTKEYLKLLGVSLKYQYDVEVDLLIIGSDEVFNCIQKGVNVGFSKELLGEYKYAKKIVSYAASCGYTTLEKVEQLGIDDSIKKYMNNFSEISVRDANTEKFVMELTGKKVYKNVDPVLVSDYDRYIVEKKDIKNYIILYSYESRNYTPEEQEIIKKFADKNHKLLVTIGKRQKWIPTHINANPFEFLGYIKNADFILTDTFHGTVFSIKYNINFATIIRESNKQKLTDLLERFELQERSLKDLREINNYYLKVTDFQKANQIIREEKEKTNAYLERVTRNGTTE